MSKNESLKSLKAIAELNHDFDYSDYFPDYADYFPDIKHVVTLLPARHALTVSYADAGSFSNVNIEANNHFDKFSDNGLINMFNGDIQWSMLGMVLLFWQHRKFNSSSKLHNFSSC